MQAGEAFQVLSVNTFVSFRQVCCAMTNQNEVEAHVSKPQNRKLIIVAVCGLVFPRLGGFFPH